MTKQTEAQSIAKILESLASNYSALPLQKLHNDTAAELLRLDAVEQAYNALLEKKPAPVQEPVAWNKRIRDSVDALLEQAGYQPDSSARHQLGMMNFDAQPAQRKPLTDASPAQLTYHKQPAGAALRDAMNRSADAAKTTRPAPAVQSQPLTAWQPIETAPKSGVWIVVFDNKGEVHPDYWLGSEINQWAKEPFDATNTHWMPLPDAPSAHGITEVKQ